MKDDATNPSRRPSWEVDAPEAARPEGDLALEIMNIMEQGIVVWSPEGYCEMHNTRVFQVLELSGHDLTIGTPRRVFRQMSIDRGDMSEADNALSEGKIAVHQPYSFDRTLASGRVVLSSGRPTRGGGYVVTFTDVTEARRVARDLEEAKKAAEAARAQAMDVLAEERARQAEAKLLAQLDEWLQSCKSLDELFLIVSRFLGRVLPQGAGELYVYSNSRDVLDGMCQWNDDRMLPHIHAESCWSLRRGRAYEYEESGLCFVCEHVEAQGHAVPPEHYLCVPIVAHGDTVGLLHVRLGPAGEEGGAIKDARRFFVSCGEHISMAIANVKLRDELRDQSIRDPLTGLFNRRYFMDAMRRQVALAGRKGGCFGLISFDADKFKLFNDTHGHDAGDMVLQEIARVTAEVIGPEAVPCRMGGEEFTALLPGLDIGETAQVAERLRAAVADLKVRYLDRQLPAIHISAGVAAYPESGADPLGLLKQADTALYEAKDGGRNRVCRAG